MYINRSPVTYERQVSLRCRKCDLPTVTSYNSATHQSPEVTVTEVHMKNSLTSCEAGGETVTKAKEWGISLCPVLCPYQRHKIRPTVQFHVCKKNKELNMKLNVKIKNFRLLLKQCKSLFKTWFIRNKHILMQNYLHKLKWQLPKSKSVHLANRKPSWLNTYSWYCG